MISNDVCKETSGYAVFSFRKESREDEVNESSGDEVNDIRVESLKGDEVNDM